MRSVWLFGCRGPNLQTSVLARVWRFVAAMRDGVDAYLVLPRDDNSMGFVAALTPDERRMVVWRSSLRHRRLYRSAGMLLVEQGSEEVRPDNALPFVSIPLVMVPPRGKDPDWSVKSDVENNCLFRYVAENEAVTRYLAIVRSLRPYQLLLFEGLYGGDGKEFEKAAGELYRNLRFAESNSVAFVGFSLTHVGGTPVATHGLAEGLLDRGWLVMYVCVRQAAMVGVPPGIPVVAMEDNWHKGLPYDSLKRKVLSLRFFRSYLKYDHGSCAPMCGFLLKRCLKRIRVRMLVSTREVLHFFVARAANPHVREKVYFFHSQSEALANNIGKAAFKLRRLGIRKAVFVTESNRQALKERFRLDNYREFCVLGNGLSSQRMIERGEVALPRFEGGSVNVCWLVRIEDNRRDEFENLFGFALYLKEHGLAGINISVYGHGSYLQAFKKRIQELGIGDVVSYKGLSTDVKATYSEYDAVVDFTENQSFGMVYIEALLNGKMVFCYKNEGSAEVLRDVPEAFFESPEELAGKLLGLRELKLETLLSYYDKIAARFSRTAIAARFADFVTSNDKEVPNVSRA